MAGYIKFEGLDGESLDKAHKGWSDVSSFSEGMEKPGAGTGVQRRRADVSVDDFHLVKSVDKASPKLKEAIVKGRVFPKVEIHVTRSYSDAGRVAYLIYELKNVQVMACTMAGMCQSEDIPVENLRLNYEEIKFDYAEADAAGKEKGKISFTWKVEEGEA